MNSSFRTGGRFRLFIRFIMTVQFLSQNQLVPVTALNGVIWDKKSGDFVRIFSIKQFADLNEYYFSVSRATETHDFNGTQLRLTSFPITNLFQFLNNDTKATGAHGELWEILSKMLNFKILYIRSKKDEYGNKEKNGSWNGLMGHIYRNETDIIPRTVYNKKRLNALEFVMPLWDAGYRLCVKKQLEYDPVWMTRLFNPSLWVCIYGFFPMLSIASFSLHVLGQTRGDKFIGDFVTLRDHFFHIFSLLCNQGWVSPRLCKYAKVITITTGLFSWLLLIAFNSQLISHITQRKFREPFSNLDSLYSGTNYKVVVKRNSLVYGAFRDKMNATFANIVKSRRLVEITREDEAFKKLCTGKHAFFEAIDVVRATNTRRCEITCIGRNNFHSWVGSGVIRGFKNKRTIDLGILRLREVGIVKRLKTKWLLKNIEIRRLDSFEPIRLIHVSLIFGILCCAMILSPGILIIENIVYFKNHRGRR